jgi:hypothetical protein
MFGLFLAVYADLELVSGKRLQTGSLRFPRPALEVQAVHGNGRGAGASHVAGGEVFAVEDFHFGVGGGVHPDGRAIGGGAADEGPGGSGVGLGQQSGPASRRSGEQRGEAGAAQAGERGKAEMASGELHCLVSESRWLCNGARFHFDECYVKAQRPDVSNGRADCFLERSGLAMEVYLRYSGNRCDRPVVEFAVQLVGLLFIGVRRQD